MTSTDPTLSPQDLSPVIQVEQVESTGSAAVDALRERFAEKVKSLTPDEVLVYQTSGFRGAVNAILGRLTMRDFSSIVKGRQEIAQRADEEEGGDSYSQAA